MHERKKGGERKDKKVKRMVESVEMRHGLGETHEKRPSTDQQDIVDYKPGSGGDANRRHIAPPPKQG
ncbi:MAG TPA: hypothetical protein PKA27_09665 [Fimbriimonadaceae bacterium]|nr:hypothetical protein [Fimbriimonadaceae bacterium]